MNKRQGLIVFITFALYLVIGGSVFMTLENSNDEPPEYPYKSELKAFMDSLLTNETLNETTYTTNQMWNEYVITVYENYTTSLADNQTFDYWTFYDAFFMCLTVVTTIGYGNISPKSPMGRAFCILYGFIGIPIAGILFAAIGDFFSNVLLDAHEKFKTSRSTPLALLISTVTYLIPGLLLFLFLPAGIFMVLEEWSYLEGFYYAFVTLTTIGFGDYVAGTKVGDTQWIYKLGLMAWIIFGLGYLSMILNFIAKAMKSKQVKKIEKTVAKNLKQTQEVLTKEMDYFMKSMNEFYLKKVKSKPCSVGRLKRTSSCPSLDRPLKRKSNRSNSITNATTGHTETSANFIFDLAMALACGEIEKKQEQTPEAMASRRSSIAQLLTMALVPPNMRSNPNSEMDFKRNSTRKSLSPLRELLSRGGSVRGKPPRGVPREKSHSLFEGMLLPLGLGVGPGGDGAQKCKSDHRINEPPSTSTPNGVPKGPVITRSVSNPASFSYVDKFVESGITKFGRNALTVGDRDSDGHTAAPSENNKCKWILGESSLEDISSHKEDKKHHPPNHVVYPKQEEGTVAAAPSCPHRGIQECEIPSIIEEEKSDCESDLSASGANLSESACSSSSDQGISSQDTLTIDIDRGSDSCDDNNGGFKGRVPSTTCFIDVDCDENDSSTRM